VTATASTQEKLDWLLNMPNGATNVANYKTQDFSAVVKDATGGKGANVVIDFVGPSHWKQNVESMAVDGRMTMLALLSGVSIFSMSKFIQQRNLFTQTGSEVDSVDLRPILYKRLRIQGSTLRSRSVAYQADLIARLVKYLLDATSTLLADYLEDSTERCFRI
jgi:NADPH:quinone reductase-like Zn-dependent oxidoreductase